MQKGAYDVIIVGAGPAGLMLARQLDASPLKILLIDKNKSITKTRAGIYGCFRYQVDRLGLSKYIVAEHEGLQLYSSKIMTSYYYKERPFVTIDMSAWAKSLKLSCKKLLGAKIVGIEKTSSGYSVISEDGNKYSTRLVVDCTGNKQVIGRLLGIKPTTRQYLNASFELTNCNIPLEHASDIGVAIDKKNSNMGVWFYMYNSKEAQFGLGDIVEDIYNPTTKIVDRLKLAMREKPFDVLFKNAKIKKTTVGVGPTMQIHRIMALDNFLSLGDAAGFGIPFSGEGLRFNLETADYASQVIYEALSKNDLSKRALDKVGNAFRAEYGCGFHYRTIMQELVLKYMTQADWDLIVETISRKFTKTEVYDIFYGRIDIRLFLKTLSLKFVMNIFLNFIKYHITKSINHYTFFKRIKNADEYI